MMSRYNLHHLFDFRFSDTGKTGDPFGAEEMNRTDFSNFSPVVVVGRENQLLGIVCEFQRAK